MGGASAPTNTVVVNYMNAIGIPYDNTVYYSGTFQQITGKRLWQVVNRFWLNVIGQGDLNNTIDFYTDRELFCFHPIIGGTAVAHAKNLVDPNTHEIIFVNGVSNWVHSGTGALPGSSCYARSGVFGSDLTNTNFNFGRFNGSVNDFGGNNFPMGNADAGTGQLTGYGVISGTTYVLVNNSGSTVVDDFGFGLYQVNKPDPSITELRNASGLLASGTSTSTLQAIEIYYNALNAGGSASFHAANELRSGHFFRKGLSPSQCDLWDSLVVSLQEDLFRKPKIAVFYGDSITEGVGTINQATQSWPAVYCATKGYTMVNFGSPGDTMESSIPLDPTGGTNFYDKRTTVKKYYAGYHKGLFIAYAVNDCGANVAGYNTTLYSTQYSTIVDYITGTKLWPANKLVNVTKYFTTEAGWNLYSAYGFAGADNARYWTFAVASEAVASLKGMLSSNVYAAQGTSSGDGIHPTTSEAALIAAQVVSDTILLD